MVLHKYKINVQLDLVFIILGPFLQIISIDGLILMITILKSPWSLYHIKLRVRILILIRQKFQKNYSLYYLQFKKGDLI